MSNIPPKPKRENYPPSSDGGTAWLMDDRNYHRARAERAIEALTKIAAFNDEGASMVLKRTSGYGFFDEPNSVEIARLALAELTDIGERG